MADTKISALTALTGANVADDDVFAIVDTSVATTKKITAAETRIAIGPRLGTEQSASGSAFAFTGIPSGVKKITLQLEGVSSNGSADLLIQIGDSGGLETTGYLGCYAGLSAGGVAPVNATTGFGIFINGASDVLHGAITLTLKDQTNFTWVASGVTADSNAAIMSITAGSKSLSGELDRISLITTDTFDAGSVNIQYS